MGDSLEIIKKKMTKELEEKIKNKLNEENPKKTNTNSPIKTPENDQEQSNLPTKPINTIRLPNQTNTIISPKEIQPSQNRTNLIGGSTTENNTKIILGIGIALGILIAFSIMSIYNGSSFSFVWILGAAFLIIGMGEIIFSKIKNKESKFLKIVIPSLNKTKNNPKLIIIIMIFFAFVLFFIFFSPDSIFKATTDYVGGFSMESVGLFFNKMIAKGYNLVGLTSDKLNERIAIAKGERGIFESSVDTALDLGVDVSFDNQRKEYYYTEKAYLFGTLTGRSLDPAVCDAMGRSCENGNVVITCRTKEGLVPINNEQSITIPFEKIEGLSSSFQCQIPPYTKENSTIQIAQVNVLFPFRTAGYARVPFLREDVYQRLKESNERIKTYTPQYTPGPLKISFSKLSNPITIREGTGFVNAKSFSFEIENVGNGVVENFNQITFSIPQGFESITCNTDPAVPDCSNNYCNLENKEGLDFLDRFSNLGNSKKLTINCQAIVSPSILESSSEITYDSFKVLAEYNYRAYDTLKIKRTEPDYAVQIACGDTCESDFGCVCPSSCSPGSKYISSDQTCNILS